MNGPMLLQRYNLHYVAASMQADQN